MDLLAMILIGLIAGWLAGLIMRGRGLGILGDIVVGIIGALLGGLIFNAVGWAPESFLGSILAATIGAVIVLALISLIRQEGRGEPRQW